MTALAVQPGQSPGLANHGCHAVVDLWQAMAARTGLSPVRVMSRARVASLKARIKEVGFEGMREAIEKIGASDHCLGQNGRGWKADFDFVITASRLTRILEGRYDNRSSPYRNGAAEMLRREAEEGMIIDGASVSLDYLDGPRHD